MGTYLTGLLKLRRCLFLLTLVYASLDGCTPSRKLVRRLRELNVRPRSLSEPHKQRALIVPRSWMAY